jgi:hypothetical protein
VRTGEYSDGPIIGDAPAMSIEITIHPSRPVPGSSPGLEEQRTILRYSCSDSLTDQARQSGPRSSKESCFHENSTGLRSDHHSLRRLFRLKML